MPPAGPHGSAGGAFVVSAEYDRGMSPFIAMEPDQVERVRVPLGPDVDQGAFCELTRRGRIIRMSLGGFVSGTGRHIATIPEGWRPDMKIIAGPDLSQPLDGDGQEPVRISPDGKVELLRDYRGLLDVGAHWQN